MKNKLTKLIEQALSRGWVEGSFYLDRIMEVDKPTTMMLRFMYDLQMEDITHRVLFDHKFAKAFWKGEPTIATREFTALPAWQYHLQQAVISDDPLEYYWKNK